MNKFPIIDQIGIIMHKENNTYNCTEPIEVGVHTPSVNLNEFIIQVNQG